jgi:ribonuclease BN (tRNA processing enzyme)
MGLSVTVLGNVGSYPAAGGACSGYLVEADGFAVLIDAGPGTVANLQEHLALDDVDAVVLSHSHPDHWTDFMVLRTALKWELERVGVPVLGPAEVRDMADAIAQSGLAPTIDWQVVGDGDKVSLGPLGLTFSATDHYVETLAVRVDHGDGSLAYSADTGPGWSFSSLGDGIDLALCEATYATDAEAEGVLHLSAQQAGAMAREAEVGRLVLTHLHPHADPEIHRRHAEQAFGGPVSIAQIHERYDL